MVLVVVGLHRRLADVDVAVSSAEHAAEQALAGLGVVWYCLPRCAQRHATSLLALLSVARRPTRNSRRVNDIRLGLQNASLVQECVSQAAGGVAVERSALHDGLRLPWPTRLAGRPKPLRAEGPCGWRPQGTPESDCS